MNLSVVIHTEEFRWQDVKDVNSAEPKLVDAENVEEEGDNHGEH